MAEQVDHLIVALLAVGGFSLQRTWDLLANLEKEGLTDPTSVAKLDEGEVVRRLARTGYDRGATVTTFMAQRLMSLHERARQGIVDQAVKLMKGGRSGEAEKLLRQVKGVGPAVFRNFAVLEGVAK